MQRAEVDGYLAALNPKVRKLASASNQVLIGQGCAAYVKTIYIGYDIDGEMVAALYAHADHLEVALALPEDAEGDLIVDASHLTWRTLPVAATIRSLGVSPEGALRLAWPWGTGSQRIVTRGSSIAAV